MTKQTPQLIDYLKAIEEDCKEGININNQHTNIANVKEIQKRFGKKFISKYIEPKFIKKFF